LAGKKRVIMKLKWFLLFFLINITSLKLFAEDNDLAALFQSKNIEGTIILSSLDNMENYIYNETRSNERFSPASTFKIPNTIISLEEGVIQDEKEIIKWNGIDQGLEIWNKDQTLETAFPFSCVWFYQELAKRIGNEKYKYHL
jgi:beta-lactamase class D